MEKESDPPRAEHRIKAFPIAWVTSGRRLLIVGGCGDTLCRVAHARRFDWAAIHVVAPSGDASFCQACAQDQRVHIERRDVHDTDVESADLVVEATMDEQLAARLSTWCRSYRVPLNAMDKLDYCDIYYPSLLMRGPLVVAISSGGESPALSAALRRWLDRRVGPGWAHAAELLAELRAHTPHTEARTETLKALARDPEFVAAVQDDDVEAMKRRVDEAHVRLRATT